MNQSILVVEDDKDLCTLLDYNLVRAGYNVTAAGRVDLASAAVASARPDLIILDVMLPDGDGFEFCRQLRANPRTETVPVIFLTARTLEVDRVLGLEIGGDDYMTKPFSPRELVARVKARLRRQSSSPAGATMESGPLQIDFGAKKVLVKGNTVPLTATEFKLLEFFAANPGRVFSREQLLVSIWGDSTHVTPRNVDVHIRRLRERIEEKPENPRWIQTVRGFGYRFEAPA